MRTYTIEYLGDSVDIRRASNELLQDIKIQLEADLASIKNQIDFAKSSARSGEYADPDWFARVNAARRHKGRQINLINAEIKQRNEQEREANRRAYDANSVSFERAFMQATKAWADAETYAMLCDAAQQLVEKEVAGGLNGRRLAHH